MTNSCITQNEHDLLYDGKSNIYSSEMDAALNMLHTAPFRTSYTQLNYTNDAPVNTSSLKKSCRIESFCARSF